MEFLNTFGFSLKNKAESLQFIQKDKEDFGVDYDLNTPLFALGVSSVSKENLESLRFLLYESLKGLNV